MKYSKAIASVVLLLAAGGGAYWYFQMGPGRGTSLTSAGVTLAPSSAAPPAAAATPARPPGGMPAAMVEATKPRIGQSRETVTAVGTFRSNESVVLRPEVASRVKAINFEEGQKVKKGQVLVQLDAATEEATVAQAEAAYALSKANNERQVALGARQVATERSV
ncbi:MAG: biotin/lipoyl-binding protein, partial [Reyranella sp.]